MPFVQRVAIALELKGMAYNIDYVDLADPPGKVGSRGKVGSDETFPALSGKQGGSVDAPER